MAFRKPEISSEVKIAAGDWAPPTPAKTKVEQILRSAQDFACGLPLGCASLTPANRLKLTIINKLMFVIYFLTSHHQGACSTLIESWSRRIGCSTDRVARNATNTLYDESFPLLHCQLLREEDG